MLIAILVCTFASGCRETATEDASDQVPSRPSILLVTLDTTRADAIGPDSTPSFNDLARKGRQFLQAYATAPQTLPSHCSMMTGLYPAAHGVHENARYLSEGNTVVAERLQREGYATAAFVSAYPLAKQFGLGRGFDVFDDEFGTGMSERSAVETTERALSWLTTRTDGPRFLWVHYFDPHYPYEPPEPFRSRYPDDLYLGEVAAMDQQLGRLVAAFESSAAEKAIIVVGDHGESLGEHGEMQHGNLLYQGAMGVPLVIAGPGVAPGSSSGPVSIRRVFHTILDWAGLGDEMSLRGDGNEVVLGEAMKPFLDYGWQPQVMAVEGSIKTIRAGRLEVYDVSRDRLESHDLAEESTPSRAVRRALVEYPVPSPSEGQKPGGLTDEDRRRLASLGYVASETEPVIREDAPRPADMAHLFEALDRASGLFVAGEYAQAIPVLEGILDEDSNNLMTVLRLASAHSALGHGSEALAAFRRAEALAPDSDDVRQYLAMHYLGSGEPERAASLLEAVLERSPNRLPSIDALASIRESDGRLEEALALRRRALVMKSPRPEEWVHVGELAMRLGDTAVAIEAFEKARDFSESEFRHQLELGVLYLAARRLVEARDTLDLVPPSDPGYPMALFKRAQVSVLLGEPDRNERIVRATRHADATTRELIAKEKLFDGALVP